MKKYIVKRLLWIIPIMLLISFIAFSLMYLSPGDPAVIYLSQGGDAPAAEAVEELQQKLGLDESFFTQYIRWLGKLFHGDMGTSIFTGNPVKEEILRYFPNTLKLTLLGMLLTLLISIPLGVLCAIQENRWLDLLIRGLTFVTGSLPGFFAAMLLTYFLGVRLKWLPTISSGKRIGILMPALTLALCLSATYIRQIRAAVVKELGENYIRMERARGLKERMVLYQGALRSAMPSIMTVAGINIGNLLGGTAIIEMVCTYQGMGRLAVDSITNRDYPLMQGYVLVMAVVYVLVNLVVDIAYAYMDPRVKQEYILEGMEGAESGRKDRKNRKISSE